MARARGESIHSIGCRFTLVLPGTSVSPPVHPPTAHASPEGLSSPSHSAISAFSLHSSPSQALLTMCMRILVQRGEQAQLPAGQALTLRSCTCRPLPVTGSRRWGNHGESELESDLQFCKAVNPPSRFGAGSFYCMSWVPQSWPHAHAALAKAGTPVGTAGPGTARLCALG